MIGHIISIGMHVLLSLARSHGAVAGRFGEYLFSSFGVKYPRKAVQFVTMSTKHLKKGDPLPPFTGTLRVYNMRFCPYAQRTILALNAKQLQYEVVNVDLTEKPEWLTAKSPLGKVPALEIEDGVTIWESLVTCEYIEEKYPQRPLTAKDPLRRAQDKLIVEGFSPVTVFPLKVLIKLETPDADAIESWYKGLERVQTELKARGTKFLFGNEPGMVDYMIWPWFERLGMLPYKLDTGRFALLLKWMENMAEDPAVKDYYLSLEYHMNYLKSRSEGYPDYDMPLSK